MILQPKIVKSVSEKYVVALKIPKYRILKKNEKLNNKKKVLKRTKSSRQ